MQVDERTRKMRDNFIDFFRGEKSDDLKIMDNFLALGLEEITNVEKFENFEPESLKIQALVRGSLLSQPSRMYLYAMD